MAKPQHFLQLRWLSKDKIIYQLTVQSIANSGLRSVHYCLDSTESKYHSLLFMTVLIRYVNYIVASMQSMQNE